MGVVDFFVILLPGALLTFLFKDSFLWHKVSAPALPNIEEGFQEWAVFILASYLLGHFVFIVASYLDHAYDFLLGRDKENSKSPFQILVRKSKVFRDIRDRIRRLLITSSNPSQLPDCVKVFRNNRLGKASDDPDVINAFQWARTNILLRYPAAAVEVQRVEADSKFFRSLVVVLGIASIAVLINAAWPALVACIILTVLSFWGYVKRRWKSVTLTYTYYIASESMPTDESDAGPTDLLESADKVASS